MFYYFNQINMNVQKTIEYEIIQQLIKIADEIDNEFKDNQLKRKCERISQPNYGSFQCSTIHKKLKSINEQGQQNDDKKGKHDWKQKQILHKSNQYLLITIGIFCSYYLIKRFTK
uniref:Transmembrane protein n=1 Tax=Schistosoma mansoni TaxID=6183 RepID=A0A5K4F9G6_SCHMA